MRASALVSVGGDATWVLGHGDLIGRLWSAALCIDDPRVSEAHAMVSLRDGQLKLLALRRRFAVDHKVLSEVVLVPGLRIQLAEGLAVQVLDVALPHTALAIESDGLPRQVLMGVGSIFVSPRPTIAPAYEGDADAWVWSSGEQWRLQVRGEKARVLSEGDTWTLHGRAFRVVSTALAFQDPTQEAGGIAQPLTVEAWYDSVRVLREGQAPVVIGGVGARVISELVGFGGPVSWELVAREVWRDDKITTANLRRVWDVTLVRLRNRLRDARIRADLIRADGGGQVQLMLLDGDVAVDRS